MKREGKWGIARAIHTHNNNPGMLPSYAIPMGPDHTRLVLSLTNLPNLLHQIKQVVVNAAQTMGALALKVFYRLHVLRSRMATMGPLAPLGIWMFDGSW